MVAYLVTEDEAAAAKVVVRHSPLRCRYMVACPPTVGVAGHRMRYQAACLASRLNRVLYSSLGHAAMSEKKFPPTYLLPARFGMLLAALSLEERPFYRGFSQSLPSTGTMFRYGADVALWDSS